MNTRFSSMLAIGLAFVVAGAVHAKQGGDTKTGDKMGNGAKMSAADMKFAKTAAAGGIGEVKFGALAAKQASNADVKAFGSHMVEDHTKANDELKQVAATKHITLPSDMNAQMKSDYAALSKLHGAAFDSKYIKLMRDDHKEDIADFSKEASTGKDADIKGFASKTLPVIKEHYKMIMDMKLGGKMNGKMNGKMDKMKGSK